MTRDGDSGWAGGAQLGAPEFLTTRLDALMNWARANSLWMMPFNTVPAGRSCLPTETLEQITRPFGNSPVQNRSGGFEPRRIH